MIEFEAKPENLPKLIRQRVGSRIYLYNQFVYLHKWQEILRSLSLKCNQDPELVTLELSPGKLIPLLESGLQLQLGQSRLDRKGIFKPTKMEWRLRWRLKCCLSWFCFDNAKLFLRFFYKRFLILLILQHIIEWCCLKENSVKRFFFR